MGGKFFIAQPRPLALPVDVLGMAFEDFDHYRGSAQVQTIWELHPAIVTIPEDDSHLRRLPWISKGGGTRVI